jgi:hypothetical protein
MQEGLIMWFFGNTKLINHKFIFMESKEKEGHINLYLPVSSYLKSIFSSMLAQDYPSSILKLFYPMIACDSLGTLILKLIRDPSLSFVPSILKETF